MIVDPVIHRVAADHLHLGHFAAHVFLQHRIDVGQKEILAVLIFGGNFGREALEDVQFGVQRLRFVQIFHVGAAPEEALAGRVLDAARIDAAAGQDGFVSRAEVFADHADDADIGEVAGGQRKMVAAPPTQRSPRPEGVSMASNATLPTTRIAINFPFRLFFRYFPISRSSCSRVACGIASGLVSMAYCKADVQAQLRSLGIAATAAFTTLRRWLRFGSRL